MGRLLQIAVRWAILSACLGGLSLPSVSAQGSDPDLERAKILFKKAEIHFSVQEFKQALVLYRQAFKAKPLAAFLFNIGQCYRYLEKHKKAVFYFERFLARSPNTPHRSEVERFIVAARKALAKPPASQPTSQKVVKKDPKPKDDPLPPQKDGDSRRVWLWTGAGASVALIAAGAITGVMAKSKNDEYHDPATPIARRRDLKDAGQPIGVTSVICLGLGGATAIATVIYALVVKPQDKTHVSIDARPGRFSATIGLEF